MRITLVIVLFILIGGIVALWYFRPGEFQLPRGESTLFNGSTQHEQRMASQREVFITEGTKHSIPLDEILSGGPPKDGIPSIDNPKFLSASEADGFLEDENPGIGLTINGESRFYPYRILVWHEIVNDTIQGEPVLITYCPLCATGIVFERNVGGEPQEFGVSGKLWQSNLLMYNRAPTEEEESLWSQVLGEAVLGPNTGDRLRIIPSDIMRWNEWKTSHPDTKVLSRDTGTSRNYAVDPYGDYYASESVSFGATFNDDRLHPKALVYGIEVNRQYKAYHKEALQQIEGEMTDTFAGKIIRVTKSPEGKIRFEADGERIPAIPGFWFSWLAVHPETELFMQK